MLRLPLLLTIVSARLWPIVAGDDKKYSFFFSIEVTDSLFSNITPGCNLALTAELPACPREFLQLLSNGAYYSLEGQEYMDVLCNSDCAPQLAAYRQKVLTACAGDPQPRPGFPATYWVDAVTSVRELMCLKDSATGKYCADVLEAAFQDNATSTDMLGGFADEQLCSECMVNVFRQQQSTPYSNYGEEMMEAFQRIQQKCNLNYPTASQPLQVNATSLFNYAPAGYAVAKCASDRTYTVVSGDNCLSISKNSHVSTGFLILMNGLRVDCTDLQLGQILCLPPVCEDYVIRSGDSCEALASSKACTFQQLVSWNPLLDDYCSNLIVDQNICVGPPGGIKEFVTIPGATVTKTATYATITASRPASVVSGTTYKCGKYYLVQPGDYCEIVAISNDISFALLRKLNPQLDEKCSNLLSGYHYCVLPYEDPSKTSSTTVQAPTSTPSGTTNTCYEWYVVQSGDSCSKIQDKYAIQFSQLKAWNPDLNDNCTNLLLGVAYCVHGPDTPAAQGAGKREPRQSPAKETASPRKRSEGAAGGVPVGWPGVDSPRYRKIMGLGPKDEI